MKRTLHAFVTATIFVIGFLCLLISPSAAIKPAYAPPEKVKAGAPDTLPLVIRHNFKNYGLNEGLGSKGTYGIFIDSRQLVWIGSYGGGAFCYDGISFTQYTMKDGLPSDIIWDFAEDSSGNILIATDKGLARFDGTKFTTLATINELGTDFVWDVVVDHNQDIWIATAGNGVFRFDGKSFTPFGKDQGLSNTHIWDIMEDSRHNIWCAANRGGVYKITNDKVVHIGDTGVLKETTARYVMEDSEGNIWATTTKGVARIYGDSVSMLTTKDGLAGNNVISMHEDHDHNLWFACYEGGITKLNTATNQWTTFTMSDGLPGTQYWKIASDRNKNIWITTNDNGISKYSESAFIHYLPLEKQLVSAAMRDENGTLWIGTYNGLVKVTDKGYLMYGVKQGLPHGMIYALCADTNGNIWIGTRKGITRFDHEYFYNYAQKQGLSGMNIYTITSDKNGSIWCGSNRGLYRISDNKLTMFLGDEGLGHYFIHQVRCDDEGKMWVSFFGGNGGGGVDFFDPEEVDRNPKAFHHFTKDNGLANNNVVSTITDANGDIWMSTISDGLCILKKNWQQEPDTSKWFRKRITQNDGLSSNMISSLMCDDAGNIWAGSGYGINCISGTEDNRSIRIFGSADGFTGLECNENVSFNGDDGQLYFGSGNMVSVYDKSLDHPDTITPLTNISGIKLFFETPHWDSVEGVSHSGYSDWYHVPDDLSLPYDQNHFTISFRGITHRAPSGVRYQWKMEGFDEEWNPVSDRREATYSNLPPGEYNFLVRSSNAQGKWNEIPASYAFEVRPPFWATWWFRITAGSAFIALLIGGVKLRTRTLENKKRELEQTVEERTAEVVQQKQEIVDSINYAKRLQEALLPPERLIRELLPDSFLLYLPKDIVAGDFYWLERKNNFTFVAAGDCTGHGVPGAMVSVVCSNALNRAVKEFNLIEPGKILDKVRELVVETFEKSESEVKDGMDVSLCVIDNSTGEIMWAGANNPLWILRKDSSVIESITADKQPVGKSDYAKPFTTHHIKINRGDMMYLFTDGYADQFGGPKGKKFKYKPLQELLISLRNLSVPEQQSSLAKNISEWKGDLEQVDDILVLGIRFND